MINENRLIELLEEEILRIDTESTPGCGNLYGRDASVMKNTLNFVIDLINEQPKVGEWIPCNERLPKQDKLLQDYLVTFEYYRYGEYDCMYKTIGIGTFSKMSHEFTFINGQTGWRDLKVLSWQPLPEPWKGKESNDR